MITVMSAMSDFFAARPAESQIIDFIASTLAEDLDCPSDSADFDGLVYSSFVDWVSAACIYPEDCLNVLAGLRFFEWKSGSVSSITALAMLGLCNFYDDNEEEIKDKIKEKLN